MDVLHEPLAGGVAFVYKEATVDAPRTHRARGVVSQAKADKERAT